MLTTAERLIAIQDAMIKAEASGGVTRIRELDGREVQVDLVWLRDQEKALRAQLAADAAGVSPGETVLRKTRFTRGRG